MTSAVWRSFNELWNILLGDLLLSCDFCCHEIFKWVTSESRDFWWVETFLGRRSLNLFGLCYQVIFYWVVTSVILRSVDEFLFLLSEDNILKYFIYNSYYLCIFWWLPLSTICIRWWFIIAIFLVSFDDLQYDSYYLQYVSVDNL